LVEHVGNLLRRQRCVNVSFSFSYNSRRAGFASQCHSMWDDMMGYRMRVVTSVAVVGLLVLASEAASQPPTVPEAPLVIEGRVLWVDFGSQTMALAPADNTPIASIDLRRIRQSDYQGFRGNEYVRVVGFILRPSRRIQAVNIYLVTPWFPMEPP
jgi:hypothetical protein